VTDQAAAPNPEPPTPDSPLARELSQGIAEQTFRDAVASSG
jgi:hypothetical protein